MKSTGNTTKAVINFLNMIGFFAWENKTVGVFDEKRNVYRSNHNNVKGAPDVVAIDWFGTYIGIEIKKGADRLSAEQSIFAAETVGRGGVYLIVDQIDDLINGLIFYGYNLTENGYVKSKDRTVLWHIRNVERGEEHIPLANKIKTLSIEERARISISNYGKDLNKKLKHAFGKYSERILLHE